MISLFKMIKALLRKRQASHLILKDQGFELRSDGLTLHKNGEESSFLPFVDHRKDALQNVDEEVRWEIARKISLLVPDLEESKKDILLDHVFNVLLLLAADQAVRVRRMIAEELRYSYRAPAELVKRLAWDEELEVAAPVLECSPLLGDRDLLEIIANSNVPGVKEAIAKRRDVSAVVSDAIVNSTLRAKVSEVDVRAIHTLLSNKNARFNENTLEAIAEQAQEHEIWHEDLVARPELTTRVVNKVAHFISHAMLEQLQERQLIAPDVSKELSATISYRLQHQQVDWEKEADARAIDIFTHGELNQEAVMQALEKGDQEFVIASISLLSNIPKLVVKDMVLAGEALSLVSLAWKAGFTVRDSIPLQSKLGKVGPTQIAYAKEGEYFPFTDDEMLLCIARARHRVLAA